MGPYMKQWPWLFPLMQSIPEYVCDIIQSRRETYGIQLNHGKADARYGIVPEISICARPRPLLATGNPLIEIGRTYAVKFIIYKMTSQKGSRRSMPTHHQPFSIPF